MSDPVTEKMIAAMRKRAAREVLSGNAAGATRLNGVADALAKDALIRTTKSVT